MGATANDEARLLHAEVLLREEGYVVNAEFGVELNDRLAEAVNRGVSLYFVAEFVVERPRWYWFNKVVVDRRLNYRLSYHAITRSYRLSLGSFHQSFDSLEGALLTMQRIRNWQVAGRDELEDGQSYNAAIRFRLDTAQLPKPFQVTAIGSREWNLGTDWYAWTFLAGAQIGQ
ncbi:DUF4390 domain-containing protein [Pseudothauera nasutitermitis]|uniref:DUF4390 domain-containing protein n=1 Tax=Pseudothauera nasutitermitis TaxID=2565930 RepID=A0A4S4AYD7_9RHOO|nr:DUF4390 domain-containing protein [Pseudothauera nasutitermitis]THF64980.1 DUF4390 domain-containing protein [Pseudothauera nasutitermitis]